MGHGVVAKSGHGSCRAEVPDLSAGEGLFRSDSWQVLASAHTVPEVVRCLVNTAGERDKGQYATASSPQAVQSESCMTISTLLIKCTSGSQVRVSCEIHSAQRLAQGDRLRRTAVSWPSWPVNRSKWLRTSRSCR